MRSAALLAVGVVLAVSRVGFAAPPLVYATHATASASVGGLTVTVTVQAPPERGASHVDLLVRLAPSALEDQVSPLDDMMAGADAWTEVPWALLEPDSSGEQHVTLAPLDEAPGMPGKAVLMTRRGARLFLRTVVATPLAAGESRQVEVTVPGMGEAALAARHVSPMVLGYVVDNLQAEDYGALASAGAVGMSVLLRSAGLDGEPERRTARTALLRQRGAELSKALRSVVEQAWAVTDPAALAEHPHPFGIAAAVWTLAEIAPGVWTDLAVAVVASGGAEVWSAAFEAAVTAAEADDPLLLASAMDVLPGKGDGRAAVRLVGVSAANVTAPNNAELLPQLDAVVETEAQARAAQALLSAAGAATLYRCETWPVAQLEKALQALAKWKVPAALQAWFPAPPEVGPIGTLVNRLGRDALVAAGQRLVATETPDTVLAALGSRDALTRSVAARIVGGAGPTTAQKVFELLAQAEYLPDGAITATSRPLTELVARLQGLLLTPLMWQYRDAAERLRLRDGDCLAQLEAARKAIHPQLRLPEPLYAECQALRAADLLRRSRLEEAVAMAEAVHARAPDVPRVAEEWVRIMCARARQLQDSGELDAAATQLMTVDPKSEHPQVRALLADIEVARGRAALERGERDAAEQHFDAARKLDPTLRFNVDPMADPRVGNRQAMGAILVLLLVIGVGALLIRRVRRQRTLHAFSLIAEEEPLALSGPRGRRYLVADHGLLMLRPLGYRLVAWAELTAAYALGPPAGDGRALLLWLGAGDAFLIPASACARFDDMLTRAERYCGEARVPFIGPDAPPEADVVQDNAQMAESLTRREGVRNGVRGGGLVIGGVVAGWLLLADTFAGGGAATSAALALGIGLGILLVAVAAADALLPLGRA